MKTIGATWVRLAAGIWLAAWAPCPPAPAGPVPLEPAAQDPPKIVWQRDLGGKARVLSVADGVALVDWDASERHANPVTWHELVALDAATGRVLWRQEVARAYSGNILRCAVSGTAVCVAPFPAAGSKEIVRAHDLRDGRLLWQHGTDRGAHEYWWATVRGSPEGFLVEGPKVPWRLYRRDGTCKWNLADHIPDAEMVTVLGAYKQYVVCHYGGLGSRRQDVLLLHAGSGRPARKFPTERVLTGFGIDRQWLILGNRIIIREYAWASPSGGALEAKDPALTCYTLYGRRLWRTRGYGRRFMIPVADDLLVTDRSGRAREYCAERGMVGLDMLTGAVRWRAPLPGWKRHPYPRWDRATWVESVAEFGGELYDLQGGALLGPFPYHLRGRAGDLLIVQPEEFYTGKVLALKVPAWWPDG